MSVDYGLVATVGTNDVSEINLGFSPISGFNGTSSDDDIAGTSTADILRLLDGNDLVTAGAGDDAIYLGDGNDIALGGSGNDVIYGGAGDDAIDGGAQLRRCFVEHGLLDTDILNPSSEESCPAPVLEFVNRPAEGRPLR